MKAHLFKNLVKKILWQKIFGPYGKAFILFAVVCTTAILFIKTNLFAAEKIHVVITADSGYPPYSYLEKGKPTGIYYQILQKIFENFDPKYSVEIKPLPWKQAISEVKNGNAFAVYPPYKVPESRPWMDYSESILKETLSVFCHSPLKKWPDDYLKSKIGINYGFTFPPSVFKLFRDYKMQVFAFDNNEAALKFLQLKKTDCYVNDRDAVLYTNNLLHFPPIQEIAVLEEANSYLGFSSKFHHKFRFKADFIQKFNDNLQKIKKNGTLDLIVSDFLKKN